MLFKDGKATACITYGKSRDESLEDFAEIISLYVLPEYWSQKQGYELMRFCMQRLKEQEFYQIYLWVLKENKRAIQFYKKVGFANDGATIEVAMDDQILTDIRYRMLL